MTEQEQQAQVIEIIRMARRLTPEKKADFLAFLQALAKENAQAASSTPTHDDAQGR